MNEPLAFQTYQRMVPRVEHGDPYRFRLHKLREMHTFLSRDRANIVVLDAVGNIGAGHLTQGKMLYDTYRLFGGHPLHVTLDLASESGNKVTRLFAKTYAFGQKSPIVQHTIERAFERAPIKAFDRMVDDNIRKSSQLEAFEDALQEQQRQGKFDPTLPTVIVTTHSVPEETAVQFVNKYAKEKGRGEMYVIAHVPDPWRKRNIRYMTAPDTLEKIDNHIIIVHDSKTSEALEKERNRKRVLHLGTASNPYRLFNLFAGSGKEKQDTTRQPIHIAAFCSGTYRPGYDQKIGSFIEASADRIRNGNVDLTIHTMCHKQSREYFEKLINKLNLNGNPHIQLLFEERLDDAVDSREGIKAGIIGQYNAPEIILGGGGEIVLEDFDPNTTVFSVFGAGHEEDNIKTAVAAGRAYDLRKIDPKVWFNNILRFRQLKSLEEKPKEVGFGSNISILDVLPEIDIQQWIKDYPGVPYNPEITPTATMLNEKKPRLIEYMGEKWKEAYLNKVHIETEMMEALGLKESEVYSKLGKKTKFVFIAAGAATRFEKDASQYPMAQKILKDFISPANFTIGMPRSLTPLPNMLLDQDVPGEFLSTMGYSIHAIRKFLDNGGENLTIVYGNDNELSNLKGVLQQIDLDPEKVEFIKQGVYEDRGRVKPAGHMDALKWAFNQTKAPEKYPYTVTLFNGDIHSTGTLRRSLVAFEYAQKFDRGLDLLIPATEMNDPKYPITIDSSSGLPAGEFIQPKLHGVSVKAKRGLSNMGIRIYKSDTLKNAQDLVDEPEYWRLKGQLPQSSEAALDAVDEALAKGMFQLHDEQGRASIRTNTTVAKAKVRVFNIADPREIQSSIKSPLNIPSHLVCLLQTLIEDGIPLSEAKIRQIIEKYGNYKEIEEFVDYLYRPLLFRQTLTSMPVAA